jgi:diguanylate cyclase (GGDEF)-like protein/PAS domain S-box-containing protein
MKLTTDDLLWIDDGEPPGLPPPLASALAEAGLAVRTVQAARVLETWRSWAADEHPVPAVVVFAEGVENPLTLARGVHQIAPLAHLVFFLARQDAEAFGQTMTRAPMIGMHWTVATGSPACQVAEVQAAVHSTRQRLAFRASLDRINQQMQAAPVPDGVPRGPIVTNHYLASILEHAEDAIVAVERDDSIATWNRGAGRLFETEPGEALGRSIGLLVGHAHAEALIALVHTAREGNVVRNHEMMCRRRDGTTFHASATLAPVRDEAGRIQAVSMMLRDVTAQRRYQAEIEALNAELERRVRDLHQVNVELASALDRLERTQEDLVRLNRTLERQATTDPLTGLKNRIVFQNSLLEMIHVAERQETPLSVLLVDVDHFKRVNDTWGHQEGDRALQAVALALGAHVREQDIVARFGGEEFAVLLPNTDLPDALIVAETLRTGCAGVFDLEPALTVSVGVAAHTHGEAEATLIGRADAALYASKAQGRNRVTAAEADLAEADLAEASRAEESAARPAPGLLERS